MADDEDDAQRIAQIDKLTPRKVGEKYVVGINREAKVLGISLEDYHAIIRNSISNSALSEPLKGAVLSSIDFNAYFGLGVVVISIPEQKEPSFLEDNMYWREGDTTKIADTAKKIADITRRF